MLQFVPFNKPYLTGNETRYIEDAVSTGKISGNGKYTQKCQKWFEESYGFKKSLLTTSCTDALEMAAILIDIQPGDEVILPPYHQGTEVKINGEKYTLLRESEILMVLK